MMGWSWTQIMSFKFVTTLRKPGLQFFKEMIYEWKIPISPSILMAFVQGHLVVSRVP